MIFHILKKSEWQEAVIRGVYEPASLRHEGFIHCSTIEQTAATVSRFFRGQTDLVLLNIDPQRLAAELRYEPPADPKDDRADQLFPHIYGPLNLDAVVRVADLPLPTGL